MSPGPDTDAFYVRTPGRTTRTSHPPPRPGRRPPRRWPPPRGARSFWRRHLFPPSAIGGILMITVLAVVVAFVATLVYATVDAGRPISGGPTSVPATQAEAGPKPDPSEGPTTTKAPENLTPDQLAKKVTPTVRSLRTLDQAGQPVEGTAFVVGSFGGQTLLLTSLALVRAATQAPAPPIVLGSSQEAILWTWEEGRDLALLVVPGSIESLPWVSSSDGVKAGDRIFAGSASKLSAGMVLSTSGDGFEHNIFIDGPLQGAPLVNQKGEILGMASRAYNPTGRGTETVFTGVPMRLACERVLRCGAGNTGSSATTTSTP